MDSSTLLTSKCISHGYPPERTSYLVDNVADCLHDRRLLTSKLHSLVKVNPSGST